MLTMDQKIPRTMKLPPSVDRVYADLMKQMQPKQHWIAASAMVLMFAESDPRIRNEFMRRVMDADLPGGSFDELTAELPAVQGLRLAAKPKDQGPDEPKGRKR